MKSHELGPAKKIHSAHVSFQCTTTIVWHYSVPNFSDQDVRIKTKISNEVITRSSSFHQSFVNSQSWKFACLDFLNKISKCKANFSFVSQVNVQFPNLSLVTGYMKLIKVKNKESIWYEQNGFYIISNLILVQRNFSFTWNFSIYKLSFDITVENLWIHGPW